MKTNEYQANNELLKSVTKKEQPIEVVPPSYQEYNLQKLKELLDMRGVKYGLI